MIRIGAGFSFGFDGSKKGEGFLKRIVIIFTVCLFLGGCAKVGHIDELLTLKDLANEQDQIGQYVEEQDRCTARAGRCCIRRRTGHENRR
jgi:hypothetical protein